MARIKINDLPKEMNISKEEMKKTFGGIFSKKGGRVMVRAKRISYPSFFPGRREDPGNGGIRI